MAKLNKSEWLIKYEDGANKTETANVNIHLSEYSTW